MQQGGKAEIAKEKRRKKGMTTEGMTTEGINDGKNDDVRTGRRKRRESKDGGGEKNGEEDKAEGIINKKSRQGFSL